MTYNNPTKYLRANLGSQGIMLKDNLFVEKNQNDEVFDNTTIKESVPSINIGANKTISNEVLTPNIGIYAVNNLT